MRWQPLDDGEQDDIYDENNEPIPVADLPIGRQNAELLYHTKVAEEKKEYTKVKEYKHRQPGESGDGPLHALVTQSHMSVYPQS